MPQASDIGLHIVAMRRSGGASRAMYDPVLGKLKEIASPALQGSGNKEQGALIGTVRPTALPPGRGTIVSRKLGQQLMQIAWITPEM